MTIGLLSPVSRPDIAGGDVVTSLAPVSRPLPDTLDGVVAAISRVSGAILLSAAIEPASGHLRIELIGPGTDAAESRVRMALGGFGRLLAIDWVPA
jgi:hypothetical protein